MRNRSGYQVTFYFDTYEKRDAKRVEYFWFGDDGATCVIFLRRQKL